ncbi:hypothetical protein ES703_82213 [subsurface metagenome]
MNLKDEEVRVKTRWRFADAKLSPAWLRLIAKLCANRREKPGSTCPDSEDGGLKNGNERIVPDE